ncbi:MAG TPA: ATP-binding protein [Pyrinomonadaceae bacterium]|nr:ATP-binding protein [Pyrinomonadaceae bacterium]
MVRGPIQVIADFQLPIADLSHCFGTQIGNRQSAIGNDMTYRNRFQSGLTMLTGLFLVAVLFAILLYVITPETPAARGPILLASFIAILIGSLLAILFLLRWLLRPYHQLVGEAQRASVSEQFKSQDEAEFVLETFQSVVAQLQEQRKALEQLSSEARERANSAEKFSERIVASLPSGLIAFDAAGLSMAINTPGRALLEVNGAALGEPYKQLFGPHEELAQMVGDCLQTGNVYRRTEIEAVSPNGTLRRLGATIAPIDLPPERGPRGALCLLTDITEVTELREQVALKNNLESLGEMSAGLAHEFKNAIATLQGYAQLLQSLELNDKAQVAAGSLLNEVRNLSGMVTAFLNFARPQPLQLEQVSLSELIDDCAAELAPVFEELNVRLIVDAEEASSVQADERMLRLALLNLMRNGAEANPGGSVHVRAARGVIEIRDSGAGISPNDMQKIFIPFFTTKAKGHGIGLALTHRIITQHGGTLTAGNSPEGGAVFTINLAADKRGLVTD